jgi:site-specific recombinase XerD
MYGHETGATCQWESFDPAEAALVTAKLQQHVRLTEDGEPAKLAPGYINKHLSALRQVVHTAWLMGLIDADQRERIKAAIKSAKGSRLKPGRNLADAEVAKLLSVCDDSLIGIRNAAIVAVLYSTGMRRAEVAGARRENYDPGERSLRVVGKGDKERTVYLIDGAAELLGVWLSRVQRREGPLFCAITRWGKASPVDPLAPRSIGAILGEVRAAAEVAPTSPHDFRRTFIGDLLDKGVDLVTVQDLVGHASPSTTAAYDRRPERQRKAAANRRRLPGSAK